MTKVEVLERDVQSLNRSELASFRDWFQSYLADEWDRQIEADAVAGKLDHLAEQALADHKAGRTKPL
ncbi:MAG: hypothetical protein JXB10_00670 [Pirellulales bacterium]|nr:hypothetical protein [Pirellulales bacterium]